MRPCRGSLKTARQIDGVDLNRQTGGRGKKSGETTTHHRRRRRRVDEGGKKKPP